MSSDFQESKLQEITDAGFPLSTFQELGLLLDTEADHGGDPNSSVQQENESRKGSVGKEQVLVQVFSKPIFPGRDTFFLEVVERRGARGFGAGNITALANSIELYQAQMKENNGTKS